MRTRDKVKGKLATIGIQRAKSFKPTPAMKDILTQATIDAYFYMQAKLTPSAPLFGP